VNNLSQGWSSALSKQIILFIIFVFIAIYISFPGKIYDIEWIATAVMILMMIITQVNRLTKMWKGIPEKEFVKRLFISSLIIRLLVMFILLVISYQTWNMFYYVGAKDEMVYYRVATEASVVWKDFGINEAYNHILESYKNEISDTGYAMFLTIPIVILGYSPVVLKIILCILGSIVVTRAYRLASLLFDQPTSRLAAILLLLYPISWFYSVIMLKEGLMVLLMIEAIITIIKLQRSFTVFSMIKVLTLIIIIFFFRSAVSILLMMVLAFSLFMQRKRINIFHNILIAVVVIGIYIYFLKSTGRYDEYYKQYTETDEYTEQRLEEIKSINPLVSLAGAPVYAVLALIGPFPSVVKVPIGGGLSHNDYYYNVAGNIFWMILAFFSIYGLYYAIRHKSKELAPLWAIVIGYQFILFKAMLFTSVRFSYPAKPLLIILAAYGIYQMKSKKWYPVYLAAALVMIIGWNYVRLKGRGG
jgi:hypothetical protein